MVRPAWLIALVVALAVPARAASTLPPRMGMYTPQNTPLAMLDSKVVVRVRGPIAETIVTQTFRNDTDRVTEATYIFPLPVDAAVSAMEIETGSRTIRASIEAREQAQQRYESAVASGASAALLDQERPDVFTQTVSAIPAKGTVVVTLRFDSVARYQGGRWELVLPMVVAPRYVPGSASGRPTTGTGRAPDTDRAPDASRVTPGGSPGAGGKTDVVLEFGDAVDDVTSPTHDIVKDKAGYTLHDAKTDHDAVIRWRARLPAAGWVEASDDGGFAAVVVEAPQAAPRKSALRMMLVLDRAATTRGDADAVKRPLVRELLSALGGKDQVAVTGSDKLDWRAPDQALSALEEHWLDRGSAFDLTKVLSQTRTDGAPIVIVTDGLVADDRGVLAAATKLGVPVHVIGIGPAPNRSLLTALAAATGGTVRFATVGDDLVALTRDVLADASSQPEPLAITWGTLVASDVVPALLPRLGAGQATLVVAKVKKVQVANARVRGDVFGFTAVPTPRPPDGATTPRGSLARRWAKLKLDELVAAGNAKSITEHALRFGLVSPYTSMVAIGDEVVVKGGVKHSVPITVSVPEGMRWQLVKREIKVATKSDAKPTDKAEKDSTHLADKRKEPKKKAQEPPRETKPISNAEIAQPTSPAAGGEASGRDLEEDDGTASKRPAVDALDEESRSAPAPEVAATGTAESMDYNDEVMLVSGSSRRTRLSVALGAGLSIANGETAPLGSLSARLELSRRRALFGVEPSLWLVDGLHAQGGVLGTAGYRVLPRLELGSGVGVRITGDGVGPALGLALRTRLTRGITAFLRYDGALLIHDGTSNGQNAGSVGIEASF